jgi:hypothetical protein
VTAKSVFWPKIYFPEKIAIMTLISPGHKYWSVQVAKEETRAGTDVVILKIFSTKYLA